MDYKYIEQLLENYWNCETSTEEEQILRSFFSQKDVPVHLLKYKELFAYAQASSKEELGEDFDSRVLDIIEKSYLPLVRLQNLHSTTITAMQASRT